MSHIAELIPGLREKLPDLTDPPALEPEPARFRLFDSVTTFLKNASQSQPLVIVLDDLHWGDHASLLLLEFLARGMAASNLLLVGTYRDVEVSRQHPLSQTLGSLMVPTDPAWWLNAAGSERICRAQRRSCSTR